MALHCFSDEEGTAPFDQGLDIKGVKIRDGIITGVDDNRDKIVFLGDLIDHGPNEVRLLRAMLDIPEGNRVLITGNRDLNKIRMMHELRVDVPDGIKAFETIEDVRR